MHLVFSFESFEWILYLEMCIVYCSRHTIELIYQHHRQKEKKLPHHGTKQEGIHMILFVPNKIFSRSEGKKSLLVLHIFRVFDFSRKAKKIDPFFAKNCEKRYFTPYSSKIPLILYQNDAILSDDWNPKAAQCSIRP